MEKDCFVPIRRDTGDGHLWIDTKCLDLLRELTQEKIDALAKKIPGWHEANPVVRIARAKIVLED